MKKILMLLMLFTSILLVSSTVNGVEWNYTGDSYNINDNDAGDIYFDGTYWWLAGLGTNKVYKYYSNWTYTGTNYVIADPTGIWWDGTNFWSGSGTIIKKYNNIWAYTGSFANISNQTSEGVQSIYNNGTDYFVLTPTGTGKLKVWVYNSAWVYTGISYEDFSSIWDAPQGIHCYGLYCYNTYKISGHGYVRQYNRSFQFYQTIEVTSQDVRPQGIFYSNPYWYMVGSYHDKIYKYFGSELPAPLILGTINSVTPANNTVFNNGHLNLSTNVTVTYANTNITFYVGDILNATVTAVGTGTQVINASPGTFTADGIYNVSVRMLFNSTWLNSSYNYFAINSSLSLLINSYLPVNPSQFSYDTINFSASVYNNQTTVLGILYIDDVDYANDTKGTGNVNFNWSAITLTQGQHSFKMVFNNSIAQTNTSNNTFYIDTLYPTVGDDFTNGKTYYKQNVAATFKFHDDQSISSFNISIDGFPVNVSTGLSAKEYNVSINYPWANLSNKFVHTMYVRVADGHTAASISDWDTGNGVLGNILEYKEPKSKELIARITGESIFDRFTTTKKVDRYTFTFAPSDKLAKSSTFIVETKDKINIIRNDDTIYKVWLTFGNHWMDFVIDNKAPDITIKQLSDTKVEVRINNIIPGAIQRYSSIGDLNIVDFEYDFYTYNITISDSATATSGQPLVATILFNKGTANYNVSATNRSYNHTGLNIASGTLLSRDSENETWTINYNSTSVAASTIFPVNYSWDINGDTFTTNSTQTIHQLSLQACTNASWSRVLNFMTYDESNSSNRPVNATINVFLELRNIVGYSINTSVGFVNTANASICMWPNSSVAVGDSIIEYYADGYTNRKFFLINTTLSNDTTLVVPLYLLNETLSNNIQEKVYDRSTGSGVSGAYVSLLRFYPELGAYRTVAMTKTDDLGYAVESLVPYDVFYKFLVTYNMEPKLLTELQTVYTGLKLLPISLTEDILKSMQYIGAVSSSVSCDKPTRTCQYIWSDSNGITENAEFKMYRENGFGRTLIYENTLASSSGILFYTLPGSENMNTSNYIAEGGIKTSDGFFIVGRDNMKNTVSIASWGGLDAILYIFMILEIVLCFVFINSGPAGIISMMILGLGIGTFLGVVPFAFSAIISLAIIGGLIIYKSRMG
jgi:hypothetical protein